MRAAIDDAAEIASDGSEARRLIAAVDVLVAKVATSFPDVDQELVADAVDETLRRELQSLWRRRERRREQE
jgi:hypothetical protein